MFFFSIISLKVYLKAGIFRATTYSYSVCQSIYCDNRVGRLNRFYLNSFTINSNMEQNWTNPQLEYAKDKKIDPEQVQALVEWCKKQPHLPEITELQGIMFLHSCYYSSEFAKVTIDNYFTARTHFPELCRYPSDSVLKSTQAAIFIGALPGRTKEGHTVCLTKMIDTRPEVYDCLNQLNLGILTLMLQIYIEGTCEGFHVVMDLAGTSFGHLTRMNLAALKKFLYFVQEAAPIRIKGIHFINLVPLTDKLVGLAKPFMKTELISLLNFHQNLDSLYKMIPRDILPEDYGGKVASVTNLHEQQCRKILQNEEFFKKCDLAQVDESQRPGKPKDADKIFGVEGSFKKLDVD